MRTTKMRKTTREIKQEQQVHAMHLAELMLKNHVASKIPKGLTFSEFHDSFHEAYKGYFDETGNLTIEVRFDFEKGIATLLNASGEVICTMDNLNDEDYVNNYEL